MELPRLTVLNEQFAIRSVLGQLGPFEATYLAWDLQNEEQVVVREYLPVQFAKRDAFGIQLHPKSEKEKPFFEYGLQRYLQEAALIAKIDHPNVVKERVFFKENGTVYRISEYHQGASLGDVLEQQGRKVSPKTAIAILMPLMDGIRAGHQHGLIHGGISPGKIYLSKTGRPLVLSYKTTLLLLAQRAQLLQAFQQPGYAPPEQYTPRGKHGPWSDVYGCAATLYAMLTGDVLPDIPTRLRRDAVPALIEQSEDIPETLRPVLLQALDMKMLSRPQTVEEFQELLADAFSGRMQSVSPVKSPATEANPPVAQPLDRTEAPDEVEAEAFADEDDHLPPDGDDSGGFHPVPLISDSPAAKPVQVKPQPSKPQTERPVYRLDDLDFVNEDAHGDGSYDVGVPPEPVKVKPEASFKPVEYAAAKPAMLNAEEADFEEGAWKRKNDFSSRTLEMPGNGRRMAIIGIVAGLILVLAYLGFKQWQDQRPQEYQVNFQATLLRADSLYLLAHDIAATSDLEAAREKYGDALEAYLAAQSHAAQSNVQDPFVERRISEINTILNEPISSQLDERELLVLISRGDSLQRSADGMMVQGDSARARALYSEARSQYLAVLDYRPDDSLANARMQEANRRILTPYKAPPKSDLPASRPALTTEQRNEQLYEMFKAQGDSAFVSGDLEQARRKFLEALAYRPGDGYVDQQLQRITRNVTESARNSAYRRHMAEGERLTSVGRLAEARREYELALESRPDDAEATRLLDRVDEALEVQTRNEQLYVTERARGDVFWEQENYQAALQSYQAALTSKPEDPYAQDKINEINQILSDRSILEAELPEGMVDKDGIYNFTEDPPVLVGGRDVLQSRLRYPALASEARIEGRVTVRMIVDETGRMLDPTILKGLGYGCDDEVLRVIRGARFEPARVGGLPVKAWHTLYFDFTLDQ